jgi:hypothetical protein
MGEKVCSGVGVDHGTATECNNTSGVQGLNYCGTLFFTERGFTLGGKERRDWAVSTSNQGVGVKKFDAKELGDSFAQARFSGSWWTHEDHKGCRLRH